MAPEEQSQALIQASMYYHELFRKTVLASSDILPLTRTQIDVMVTLHLDGPLSMGAISERVGIAPEQATRAVKRLRELGLAETDRSQKNRRMVIATTTERGETLMDEHLRCLNANLRASLQGLDPADMDALADAAATAVSIMRKTGLRHIVSDMEARRAQE